MALLHASFSPVKACGVRTSHIYFSNISWKLWVLDAILNPYLGMPLGSTLLQCEDRGREMYNKAKWKDEIWPLVTIWMGLENTRLCEISQTEKVKNHMISFICGIEKHSNTKPRKTKTPRHKKTAQWLPEGKELRGVSEGWRGSNIRRKNIWL